jgi:hypothetical protein
MTNKILSQTAIFLWHTKKNDTAYPKMRLKSKDLASEFTPEMEFLIINLTKRLEF